MGGKNYQLGSHLSILHTHIKYLQISTESIELFKNVVFSTLFTYTENELFHAPYDAAFQTNLDPMWMCGGFRENIFDDAFRKLSGSLILFLYNLNTRSWFDVRPDDFFHLYRL